MRLLLFHPPDLDDIALHNNMTKVRSTLRQFVRDWSEEGIEERRDAYEPILECLEKYVPITETYRPKVLCPGCGLGRLPFEVAKKGYQSEGNEFSYFMLLTSNFVLNFNHALESLTIQPYCLGTCNRRKREDHLKKIIIPNVTTANTQLQPLDFTMSAGEFIEVYGTDYQRFDAILTCYFLDTAKNVFDYIKTIAKILKPNALWCNIGPLLFHYVDVPNEVSIELAWDEIRQIISKWFIFVEEDWRDSYYTSNIHSMMQVQYHCIFFCARRNEVLIE